MSKLTRRAGDKLRQSTSMTTRVVSYLACNAVLVVGGVALVIVNTPVAMAIGTSLMATGIAGGALFVYVLFTEELSRRFEVISEFGVLDIYEARSVSIRPVYEERLTKATKQIDLLGFGQRSFREDFGQEFARWADRDIAVRILLLDPDFPQLDSSVADIRDGEERHSAGSIRRDVHEFLTATEELRREKQNFRVRIYRCLPMLNIMRIDNELFWGPYLLGKPSRNAPTLLVARGPLFETISDHFEAIWSGDGVSVEPE